MILSRELGKRIWGGSTNIENGGGGVSGDYIAGLLTGYAKESWVDEHYISIDFFSRLFQAHGTENGSEIDVIPNDMDTTITSVESMFGFWTNLYISALGSNGAAPAGISLGMLTDVNISGTPSAGQVLTFDAVTQKWVNGNATGASSLANLTDVLLSQVQNGDTLLYDSTTSKWYNSALKTINGQSLLGSGDISVGGGASGNYLPLTGGTLTGSNNFLNLNSSSEDCWIYYKTSGTNRTSMGYYGQMSFIANETNYYRIGMLNDGTPAFRMGASASATTYPLIHTGNLNLLSGAYLPLSGGTLSNVNNILTLTSSSEYCWMYFNNVFGIAGTVGYFMGLMNISAKDTPTGNGRIGVLDDGTPQYWAPGWAVDTSLRYKLLHSGASIEIWSTGNLFNEGIRIHPASNGWCGITFCATDNTGGSGTSANTWGMYYYAGNIYIAKNSANSGSEILCNVGGNWGCGTNSPSYKLHVAGTIYATGAITALSDARKKDITGETGVTVEQIAHAPAVQFLWKDKERRKDGQQVGTLAQYWQTVLPEVVMDRGGELSMQYGVAALVSAIITARKVVDHERRITELEKENERLKKEVEQLRLN